VSTRSVDDLVEALGIDTGISKSEVSRICAGLDEAVSAFRSRTLGHTQFPYVYLDATYLHVREGARTGTAAVADVTGQVFSKAVVGATGINRRPRPRGEGCHFRIRPVSSADADLG
jgi:putative transposase